MSTTIGKFSFEHLYRWITSYFYQKTIPVKVSVVRAKSQIRVLFILHELESWKTENLYLAMVNHPRFCPILGVTYDIEKHSKLDKLTEYLENNSYPYEIMKEKSNYDKIKPDIVFYQKPYPGTIPYFLDNRLHYDTLFCDVNYAFNSIDNYWSTKQPLYKDAWLLFFENELAAKSRRLFLRNGGKNIVVTGLPIQDQLLIDKSNYSDPWLEQPGKKRIIYAPHHSIENLHLEDIGISTFLENGEFMLQMAEKYKESVQWIFKPHPHLYSKLATIWGSEKTDEYYRLWDNRNYSQIALGKYDAIFKYSDAMIHDCCSFRIEYQYTCNPALYLLHNGYKPNHLNQFAQQAFDLHYKGESHEDIEQFIKMVIDGKDTRNKERLIFYKQHLVPPHKKSACQNIINAILGEEEYRSH